MNEHPLGKLISIQSGYAFKSNEYTNEGHFLVRIGNVQDGELSLENPKYVSLDKKTQKFELREGDFLTSLTGNIGRVARVSKENLPAALNQRVARLTVSDKSKLSDEYFYYFLRSDLFRNELTSISHGVAQQNVSPSEINNLSIPLPTIPEQQRIVAILDEAFAGIATATANAEKNLQNARELFDSTLQAVFAEKGEGWVESSVGECCQLKSGTSVNTSLELEIGDVPYVKVSDMSYEGNDIEITGSSRFLSNEDTAKNAIFPVGTTIFPKRGGAIMTNKKRITAVPICADLNIMGVIPSDGLEPKYIYFYFLGVDMRKLGGGSSIPQINNYDISPLSISYPTSRQEQLAVVNRLEEIQSETQRLERIYQQKINDLTELKQSILQKAFAGELH